MSHLMANRQGALAAAIAGHDAATRDHASRSDELLSRIRSFFGLGS